MKLINFLYNYMCHQWWFWLSWTFDRTQHSAHWNSQNSVSLHYCSKNYTFCQLWFVYLLIVSTQTSNAAVSFASWLEWAAKTTTVLHEFWKAKCWTELNHTEKVNHWSHFVYLSLIFHMHLGSVQSCDHFIIYFTLTHTGLCSVPNAPGRGRVFEHPTGTPSNSAPGPCSDTQ